MNELKIKECMDNISRILNESEERFEQLFEDTKYDPYQRKFILQDIDRDFFSTIIQKTEDHFKALGFQLALHGSFYDQMDNSCLLVKDKITLSINGVYCEAFEKKIIFGVVIYHIK